MDSACPSDVCEIKKLCGELHKLGYGKKPDWMAVVLFVRNLVTAMSSFTASEKEAVQAFIVKELSQRDPSTEHFFKIINYIDAFIVNNSTTSELRNQLEQQQDYFNSMVQSVSDFLLESLAFEQERGVLLGRFERETLEALNSSENIGSLAPKLRVLVKDMLRHYRDKAIAWEHKAEKLQTTVNVDHLLAPLHNRRSFDDHIHKAVKRCRNDSSPLSVLMIDVDNFKTAINDVYGHHVGDDILRTLAKIIHSHASKCNWFAARYGGDELVMVCEAPLEDALLHADAIRLAVQNYEFRPRIGDKFLDGPLRFTVSIGVAGYQADWTAQEFVDAADRAMYQVKESGKNNVGCFSLLEDTSREEGMA